MLPEYGLRKENHKNEANYDEMMKVLRVEGHRTWYNPLGSKKKGKRGRKKTYLCHADDVKMTPFTEGKPDLKRGGVRFHE
uniref:Transposase n=1 Tax=Strongyloides venezuelensis TaxID=75913 RepID=A0A0K0FJ87_STRVS